MKCRGTETRRRIAKKYKVVPIMRMKILPGQTKKESDAGGFIEENGQYYIFDVLTKDTNDVIDHIVCGLKTANELIMFAHEKELALFNPFKTPANGNNTASVISGQSTTQKKKVWNSESKELDKAIRWVFMLLDKVNTDSPLFENFQSINKYSYHSPFDREIKAVNTIIYNLFGQSLKKEIKDHLGKNISKLKPGALDFNLLKKRYETIVLNSKKQNKKQIINPQSFE
ncbi:hypothetical protein [Limosilactobacillus reuteri]|uniref:hypothetical protein n=1 Tax=Limosilactobacillus reuteri TaxID=1598 RepID=UPI00128C248D|nr:hypothetical protein [Limosilactobacillus reuteri]MCC4467467.1 hypothetical protein [Limosilactobacillus reuteri]MCC4474181.1 hypothetical protein [Limosilactobacillus reuteri]MQB60233.1 hypothetical protein [Limosilactobacillus reuteri]MQB76043.1 hypothetical protein [Limosilactobacillus reuteri]MQB99436.1 hypothetical protein [Limosilactobacillus reuteri]